VKAPHRARQAGQAIVYIVALLPFIFISVLVVYNTAAATREKMKLQNTADATTYSASVLTARSLNYLAYTNRAMAANEASIATLASVQTSMAAFITSASNIQEGLVIAKSYQGIRNLERSRTPVVGPFFFLAYLANVGQAQRLQRTADRIAGFVEPVSKPLQVGVDVLRVLNQGISASQVAMLASTAAQLPQLIVDVLKANDPDVSVPPGETAILATKFVADLGLYLNTYHQSASGPFDADEYNEVLRFAHAAQATRDDWTKKRRFLPDWASWIGSGLASSISSIVSQSPTPAGFGGLASDVLGGLVEWKGGTELVAANGIGREEGRIRWQSGDAIEIKLPLAPLYTDFFGGLGDTLRGRFGLGAGAAAAGGPNYTSSWEGQRLTLRSYAREARTYGGLNDETGDTANMVRGSFRRAAADRDGDILLLPMAVLIFNAKLHYGPRTSIGTNLTQNWSLPRYVDIREHPPMEAHGSDNWIAEQAFKGANPLKWGKNTDKGPALSLVVQKGGDLVRTGQTAGFGDASPDGRTGLRDQFAGQQIKALSTAQVYFRRPQDRWARRDFSADDPPQIGKYNVGFAGGYIEHRSLFSPYWHAHNIEPSLWARAVAMGGAVLGAEEDNGE
jgi:hypothetical protein